ncbi:MAG: cobalamin-independent methionine synthase II family protein [Nitrososphaerota archaeon]|nr:cobalamin-independent methionine synthase II family protein [Nitrososphaerota archaeon]MDG7024375.1 cobalamin-independent methionine synthase II family protein [Nitrososphaerota archaeon]
MQAQLTQPFSTTVVGSFSRPRELIEATKKRSAGEISQEELDALLEKATEDTIRGQEAAGLDVITDGEQRRSSFVSFVGDKIPGFKVMHITELNPDAMEILKRNKVQLTYARAVVAEELRDSVIAADEFEKARKYSKKPFKVTLPAPYLVMWESWQKKLSKEAYPTPEDFAYAYAKLLRKEVLRLKEAGASFIQVDEPMLGDLTEAGEKPDRYRRVFRELYGQEYRGFKEELKLAVDLLNAVIGGVGGVRIGVHMDRWPNKDSPYFDLGYERFLPELLETKTKQFVLEYTTPGTGDPAKLVREFPKDMEIGFGCISVQNYEVEAPEQVVARVKRITGVVEPERIWLNPDCGFAPGMYRTFPREVAFAKLRSMTKAAEILREAYS